jgi:uncharacterized protein YdiU (UPF0061 family)
VFGVAPCPCRFTLRNWLAQRAIERAEIGDFSELNRLLELLKRPFAEGDHAELVREADARVLEGFKRRGAEPAAADGADVRYDGLAPLSMRRRCTQVTCSS